MNNLYYTMDNVTAIRNAEGLIAEHVPAPVVENEDFTINFNGEPSQFIGTMAEAKVIARFLKDSSFDNVSITRTITEKVDF